MDMRLGNLLTLCLLALCLTACSLPHSENDSGTPNTSGKAEGPIGGQISSDSQSAFGPLLNRIWRVSNSSYGPASGSIYIFLSNGALLETSCVETYRIAVWSVDKSQPDTLRVVEDQQQVFTATLGESTSNTLHLHQKLLRSTEVHDVTLSAIEGKFVCPDLPKK